MSTTDNTHSTFSVPVSDFNLSSTDEKASEKESLPILTIKTYKKKTMHDLIIRKSNFIKIKTNDIESDYKLCEELGQGAFGVVYRAVNKLTNDQVAIKKGERSKIKKFDRFIVEVNSLAWLDHPYIVKLYDVYQDDNAVYLVTELGSGGELFDRITENEYLSEDLAATYFRQLIHVIYYCHKNKIGHRDIKPENIIFKSKDKDSGIKLIDFGLSKSYFQEETDKESKDLKPGTNYVKMTSLVGTTFFLAPEVIQKNYTESGDLWSAGVMLYTMLGGYPPFLSEDPDDIAEGILNIDYSFDDDAWDTISEEAKDLISKILVPEANRLTIKQILKHPWLTNHQNETELPKLAFDRLKKFNNTHFLKKAAMTYFASRTTDDDVKEYTKNFLTIDKNNDGYITLNELKQGYESTDANSINYMFKNIDVDQNGAIDYTEYIAANLDQEKYLKDKAKLLDAFRRFDSNGDGNIDKDEMKQIFSADDELLNEYIDEIDEDGDGKINFKEFEYLMQRDS